MERRLLKAIINPAMVVSWALGLWLAWDGGWFAYGWFQAKVVLVLLMSALHGFLSAACANSVPTRTGGVLNSIVLSMRCQRS